MFHFRFVSPPSLQNKIERRRYKKNTTAVFQHDHISSPWETANLWKRQVSLKKICLISTSPLCVTSKIMAQMPLLSVPKSSSLLRGCCPKIHCRQQPATPYQNQDSTKHPSHPFSCISAKNEVSLYTYYRFVCVYECVKPIFYC